MESSNQVNIDEESEEVGHAHMSAYICIESITKLPANLNKYYSKVHIFGQSTHSASQLQAHESPLKSHVQ